MKPITLFLSQSLSLSGWTSDVYVRSSVYEPATAKEMIEFEQISHFNVERNKKKTSTLSATYKSRIKIVLLWMLECIA